MSETALALPGAVTETSLELPADLSFENWERAGEMLGRISRACQWWIGDWINFGERVYGEKYAQALDVTGLDYSTVSDYAWLAKTFEPSVRTELSWSHHKQVAALEPAERDKWLEQAATEDWSVSELRKQIKNGSEPEPELCPTCGHRLPKGMQIRRMK